MHSIVRKVSYFVTDAIRISLGGRSVASTTHSEEVIDQNVRMHKLKDKRGHKGLSERMVNQLEGNSTKKSKRMY